MKQSAGAFEWRGDGVVHCSIVPSRHQSVCFLA
jgi:hypothetical protein